MSFGTNEKKIGLDYYLPSREQELTVETEKQKIFFMFLSKKALRSWGLAILISLMGKTEVKDTHKTAFSKAKKR